MYGEISFESFGIAFEKIKKRYGGLKPGGHFYDLGSGTGKPVRSMMFLLKIMLNFILFSKQECSHFS